MGAIIRYGNTGLAKFGRSGNEGKTLAFYMNDDGTWEGIPFGHIRGSNAYEENNGVLTEVGVDVPRFQDGKYFTEGASTNLLTYSKPDSSSPTNWSPLSGTGTRALKTLNNSLQGIEFTAGVGDRPYISQSFVPEVGKDYVLSVYIEKGALSDSTQVLSVGGGGFPATQGTVGDADENGRVQLTVTATSTTTTSIRYGLGVVSSEEGVLIAGGVQLEEGTVATSYIETEATTLPRQEDTGIQSLVDLSEQIDSEYGKFEIRNQFTTIADTLTNSPVSLSDSTDQNIITIEKESLDDSRVKVSVTRAGVEVVAQSIAVDLLSLNKIAVIYGNNKSDGGVYVNDVLSEDWSAEDTSFSANTLNKITLSDESTGNSQNSLLDYILIEPLS